MDFAKYYLADGFNNNKIIGEFETKEELNIFLKNRYFDAGISSLLSVNFKDYKNEFTIIPKKEMESAVKEYGKRKLEYWT